MMMKLYIALLAASLLLLSGCGNKPKPGEDDTLTSGTITIAVDETFRPIIRRGVTGVSCIDTGCHRASHLLQRSGSHETFAGG